MDEKLKLVTDFAELRAGMIVVVNPCTHCRASHRGILTRFEPRVALVNGSGETTEEPAWRREPPTPHAERRGVGSWVSPRSVRNRRVYRVDDGLEDTQTTNTAKPKRLASTLPESR